MKYIELNLPDGSVYNLKLTIKQRVKLKNALNESNKKVAERQGGKHPQEVQG